MALPAFLNQREKAQDSTAKSDVRTAQTAMETYYTDHQSYEDADVAALVAIEPALTNANELTVTGATENGYTLSVESKGSNKVVYSIENTAGTVSRSCDKANTGGCGDSTW
nr:type IV pilin protein [Solirubrobacter pauli]